MNNIYKTFLHVGAVAALLTCNAFANENRVSYSLSLVGMNMDYREYDTNGILADTETANVNDIIGYEMSLYYALSKHTDNDDEIGINIMQLDGRSVYIGSALGSGDPYGSLVSSTQNTFVDTSINYKHTYRYRSHLSFIYGVGFGYHSWNRKLSSTQEELYEWFSIRPMLGTRINYKNIGIGISAEYQRGFNTTMQSSNPALNFTLGGADIFQVTVPVTYSYSEHIELFVKTIFSKQSIKKSNDIRYGGHTYYEPDSTDHTTYIKLGATFKF